LIVVEPSQYAGVLEAMDRHSGSVPAGLARSYAARAFARTAEYDGSIARHLAAKQGGADAEGRPPSGIPAFASEGGTLPDRWAHAYRKRQPLRYGENPGQEGALYASERGGAVETLVQIRGKTLSYNNLLDVEAAVGLLREFDRPAAVVVKHRNPSG